jgi:signal transduction histidine kinase
LCGLVRELVALNYDEFETRNMNLDIDIPEEALICNIDEKEMKRAISNLLVNAYKHNECRNSQLFQICHPFKRIY